MSVTEAVTRELRHRILNNDLPADSRLVEANLASEFGVSRGTVRDAMRMLQGEGLITIVPRRFSVVTRMPAEDAEDVCFARFVLEDASLEGGLGTDSNGLVKELKMALEQMSTAARMNDLHAVVDCDTQFHEALINVSGRRRLKQLWAMLNGQMGALMRAEMERQGIELTETVHRHIGLLDAVRDGDLPRLRSELRAHYLSGFPIDGTGG